MTDEALLDPAFLRRLAKLKILVRRKFAGSNTGTRRSSKRGASAEFADHRAYAPGDDIRRIDWNAYARLEELVIRLYVAEEELSVYLLVDSSASLSVGEPSKLLTAKRIAAALAYISLSGSERVSVVSFSAGYSRSPLAPGRGQKRIGPTLRYLEQLEANGETDLHQTVQQFLARKPKPGVAVVISDFLDPGGYKSALDALVSERFECALFHVLSEDEVNPEAGDFTLIDSERGDEVQVSLDPRTKRAYQARLSAFVSGLSNYARTRGMSYTKVFGDNVSLERVLLSYLVPGSNSTEVADTKGLHP